MKNVRNNVLIVDDHPAIREALTIRISRLNDLQVCGEAADVEEALHLVKTKKPDVAVVDIALKKGDDGLELIKRVRARSEKPRILVWSMFDEQLYAERVLRAGASGYINKEQATDRIIQAIREVLNGNIYLSEPMREKLVRRTVSGKTARVDQSPTDVLTDRELQVFRLIGDGITNRVIAKKLHLSVHTVETHRQRIKAKLGFNNSAELAREAVKWNLENG